MNYQFKGSKGKWKRVKHEATAYYPERNEVQYGIDGECVAEFVANDYDAKLISKAPEMFELLKKMLDALDSVELSSETEEIIVPLMAEAETILKEATEL